MTAVEGGDFEDGIRLMNRILAVRGQVVPVSPTPLTLHARLRDGTVVDGQSHDHADGRHRAGLDHPDDVAGVRGRAGRDRRGRADRPRPGQPLHEPAAEPADPGHPRRGPRRRARRASSSATSRPRTGETTGFDLAAHVEALVAHTEPGPRRHRRSPTTSFVPGARARRRRAIDDAPAPKAVQLRWPPAAHARRRGSSSTTSSTRPTPTTTIRPGWRRRSSGRSSGEVGIRRRSDRPDDQPGPPDVSRSERDLVTALRAELAAIDPSRPCDRVAEVDGLGPEPDRPRGIDRRGSSTGCAGWARGQPASAVRLGTSPPSTAASPGCAAGSSPAARSASPAGGRTSSSSSSPTRRPSSPRGSPSSGCRCRGGSVAAAAS